MNFKASGAKKVTKNAFGKYVPSLQVHLSILDIVFYDADFWTLSLQDECESTSAPYPNRWGHIKPAEGIHSGFLIERLWLLGAGASSSAAEQ